MNTIMSDSDTFVSQYWDEGGEDYRGIIVPKPKFGDRLRNGAKVIAYKHVSNGDANWYPNGIVLANKKHGTGEWVVWTACIYDFKGDWHCEHGHYFSKIEDATRLFAER